MVRMQQMVLPLLEMEILHLLMEPLQEMESLGEMEPFQLEMEPFLEMEPLLEMEPFLEMEPLMEMEPLLEMDREMEDREVGMDMQGSGGMEVEAGERDMEVEDGSPRSGKKPMMTSGMTGYQKVIWMS